MWLFGKFHLNVDTYIVKDDISKSGSYEIYQTKESSIIIFLYEKGKWVFLLKKTHSNANAVKENPTGVVWNG